MIIAKIGPQFQVIDYATLPLFLPLSLCKERNAAGHNGFMSRPYFSKHQWWAALPPPPQPRYSEGPS